MMLTNDEYRTAAQRLYGQPGVSVAPHASAQRVNGGSFIEMTVWVQDAAAAAIRQEREFNARPSVKPTT